MERFGGEIPNTAEELASIKGLGPYTVGAILSFAFHQKAPAIDGNVLRVIARLFGIDTPINRSATLRQITETVDRLLPDAEPWVIMEALIELGATVCQKKARCADCPVAAACSALRSGRQAELPVRPPRAKATKLHRVVPILYHDGQYLLRRCAEGEVMQDLHEFPFFEAPERISGDCVKLWLEKHLGVSAEEPHALPRIKHGFTRYQVTLFPYFLALGKRHELQGFQWTPWEQIRKLAFSSGHRRVLDLLGKEGFDAHSTHGSL
jgi:A/G-specific adenine glycosylase